MRWCSERVGDRERFLKGRSRGDPSSSNGSRGDLPSTRRHALVAGALAACCSLPWGEARASALRLCDSEARLDAAQKDTLFRFAGIVKAELDRSGQRMALVARSGLDLSRFGVRYSHAGFSLQASENAPWSVRQLYYACDESRPRIFDQGMSGFLMGTDDPSIGYLSAVFLPPPVAASVERAALDKRQALQLLSPSYSANAYPFGLLYQNCNQWVIEMLAVAWGGLTLPGAAPPSSSPSTSSTPLTGSSPSASSTPSATSGDPGSRPLRAAAQQWLHANAYRPSDFVLGHPLWTAAAAVVPWLHNDDHPAEDIAQATYRVSMPAAIERFVASAAPGATRIEFCHTDRHVVIRRGWEPIADGCRPGPDDTVVALD